MTKDYYGTKRVTAWPESKYDQDSCTTLVGYAVKYEDGYVSWSPKATYQRAEGRDGQARRRAGAEAGSVRAPHRRYSCATCRLWPAMKRLFVYVRDFAGRLQPQLWGDECRDATGRLKLSAQSVVEPMAGIWDGWTIAELAAVYASQEAA